MILLQVMMVYLLMNHFIMVEVMPSFRGGDINKFRQWLGTRTNYPQAAIEKKIRGTVFLTFIVEKDGSVSNVTVVKGVDPILDNEAIKVISESPKWTPGLQRGQPVRVRFQMPLNFVFELISQLQILELLTAICFFNVFIIFISRYQNNHYEKNYTICISY